MSKTQTVGVVLAIIALFNYSKGLKGTTIDAIVDTWLPAGVAVYLFFA